MSLDIQFGFICQRRFDELSGGGDLRRFCDTCQTEVVNLDPLDDEARLKLFEEAAKTGSIPCVSATKQIQGGQNCAGASRQQVPPLLSHRTAGIPMMPENLKQERERIERLREGGGGSEKNRDRVRGRSLLSKLKFW